MINREFVLSLTSSLWLSQIIPSNLLLLPLRSFCFSACVTNCRWRTSSLRLLLFSFSFCFYKQKRTRCYRTPLVWVQDDRFHHGTKSLHYVLQADDVDDVQLSAGNSSSWLMLDELIRCGAGDKEWSDDIVVISSNDSQSQGVYAIRCDLGASTNDFLPANFNLYFKSMMQQTTPDCLQWFVWTSCNFKQPLRFDFTSASFFQVCVLPVYPSRRRSTWSKFHPRCALRVPISI